MDPKTITGLDLTEEELNQATRRLAFFAPRGAKEYVIDLYDFLVSQSLASLPAGSWPGRSIYEKLRNLIGIQIEYEEVVSSLGRLVNKEEISCTRDSPYHEDATFMMSHSNRDAILSKSRKQGEFEDRIISQWKEEVVRLYPNELSHDDLGLLENDLREFVYRITSYSSIESVLLYYSGESNLESLATSLSTESIGAVLPDHGKKLNRIRGEVLPKFFRSNNKDRKKFIDGLLQSTFILHMTQLDPTCSAIVKGEMLGGRLYVDTNFLFRLFGLHTPEMFYATKYLADLSQELGYSLVVSPRTIDEYKHAVKDNLHSYRSAPILPQDLLEAVVDLGQGEDPIIAYYRRIQEDQLASKTRSHISADAYYEYYIEIESLLEDFSIEISNDGYEEIISDLDSLAMEASRIKSFVDDKRLYNSGEYFNELKYPVAEHDAFHRLLILRLRAGYDGSEFFDVPYWFLTCDTKLPAYDRSRRYSEKRKTPFCVLTSQWLQTLRPFLSRSDPVAFSDSISSPLLRAYNPIPNSVIIDVASRLKLSKGYKPAIGKMAMRRQFLLQFASAPDEETQEELIESIFIAYAEEMEEKSRKSQERVDHLENNIDRLEKELSSTKKNDQKTINALKSRIEEIESESQNSTALIQKTKVEKEEAISLFQEASSQAVQLKHKIEQSEADFHLFKRKMYSFIPFMVFAFGLILFREFLTDDLFWLSLSWLLLCSYASVLISKQPWRRGKVGKMFVICSPIAIMFSAALPLGMGSFLSKIIGIFGNIGGVVSFILLFCREDSQ